MKVESLRGEKKRQEERDAGMEMIVCAKCSTLAPEAAALHDLSNIFQVRRFTYMTVAVMWTGLFPSSPPV